MKQTIAAVFFLTFLAACSSNQQKPQAKYTCVAGPSEQCASDLWYADWLKLKAYQEKYKPPQDEEDRMVGLATRLQKQIPAGFAWDDKKERFVAQAPPQAPAPAPTK